jgi:hypothetical protein
VVGQIQRTTWVRLRKPITHAKHFAKVSHTVDILGRQQLNEMILRVVAGKGMQREAYHSWGHRKLSCIEELTSSIGDSIPENVVSNITLYSSRIDLKGHDE